MTLGPVMLDIEGTELNAEDREILAHPLVGGVILFTRNYHDPRQLADLVREIRSIKNPGLLISVDQEGGKVQRFVEHFVKLPPMQVFGDLYESDPQLAKRLIANAAKIMAQELLACGIDISFAPVLDLKTEHSAIIGNYKRGIHSDPMVISELGSIYIDAMNQAGMKATGKHFPGHGTVAGDTHTHILRDNRTLAEIEASDLIPFENLMAKLSGIMVAHVVYEEIDPQPAGFSKFWVTDYLRKKLNFSGLIFTDALDMKGAETKYLFSERVDAALEAGCDMALVCNNRKAAIEVLDNLAVEIHPLLAQRINGMRGKFGLEWKMLHAMPEWRMMVESLQDMECI